MIGGRVLDTSAILQFASLKSVYMQAAVWVAAEEGLVLAVPAPALAEAWAQADPVDHDALEVLMGLPVTVIDPLGTEQARPVGQLLAGAGGGSVRAGHTVRGSVRAGHIVLCARRRGWPVITAEPDPLLQLDPRLEVEELP